MAMLTGIALALGGLLLIVFRRRASRFMNESDEIILKDRPNPLGRSSTAYVVLSGIGLIGFGLWILWRAVK